VPSFFGAVFLTFTSFTYSFTDMYWFCEFGCYVWTHVNRHCVFSILLHAIGDSVMIYKGLVRHKITEMYGNLWSKHEFTDLIKLCYVDWICLGIFIKTFQQYRRNVVKNLLGHPL